MDAVIDAAKLSCLIGLIYDSAIDPERWPIAVEAIRLELGGANATLDLIDIPNARSLRRVSVNIPPMLAQSYSAYVSDMIGMWGGVERMLATPFDRPISLARMVPDRANREDNRYHEEWKTPQGTDDTLVTWLARDAATVGVLGFGRLGSAGPFGDREFQLATLLIPHLQRAAAINRLLDVAARERSTFAALIDTLSVPIVLVDAALRIVHANAAAAAVFERGEPLRRRDGVLRAATAATSNALSSAVAQIAMASGGSDCRGFDIPIQTRDGPVGALHIVPLSSEATGSTAIAAVFLARSAAPVATPTDLIAALFGLTPTESAVFEHVAGGCDVPSAADRLGVAQSTVRTHLLRIYDKTGVRRQAELVRLSASLAMPAG